MLLSQSARFGPNLSSSRWTITNFVVEVTLATLCGDNKGFYVKNTLHKMCQYSYTDSNNIQTVVIIYVNHISNVYSVKAGIPFSHAPVSLFSESYTETDKSSWWRLFIAGCHDDPDSVNDEKSSTWRPFRFSACRNIITHYISIYFGRYRCNLVAVISVKYES